VPCSYLHGACNCRVLFGVFMQPIVAVRSFSQLDGAALQGVAQAREDRLGAFSSFWFGVGIEYAFHLPFFRSALGLIINYLGLVLSVARQAGAPELSLCEQCRSAYALLTLCLRFAYALLRKARLCSYDTTRRYQEAYRAWGDTF